MATRKRELTTPERHQLRIARENFRNPAKARFLGGPSPSESRDIITRLTGRDPGPVVGDSRLPGYHRGKVRIAVRQSNYRGKQGWLIYGTDTRGRHPSIFATTRSSADQIAAKLRSGQEIELADFGQGRSKSRAARRAGMR